MEREPSSIIVDALAEYFECDPDSIGDFTVVCERSVDDSLGISTILRGATHRQMGMLKWLEGEVEAQQTREKLNDLLNASTDG